MEWTELLKLYGPQAIPWIALAYLAKWHLARLDQDIENRTKMVIVLEGIKNVLEKVYDRVSNAKNP